MVKDYGTLLVALDGGVATVTLNRPERLNAFNDTMLEEFSRLWGWIRDDPSVRAVVLRGAGDRAFCTGVDVVEGISFDDNPFAAVDPGTYLSPKTNGCWKPIIAAVHGMAAGGAFYLLNEADIIICSEDATFFDPHLTYGMVSALEPIGLARRINLGDVLRWALMGIEERMSAQRALAIGLVTEVTPRDRLWARADEIARRVAARPPAAVQGTLRAIWESLDVGRRAALDRGLMYPLLGNPIAMPEVDRGAVDTGSWELR